MHFHFGLPVLGRASPFHAQKKCRPSKIVCIIYYAPPPFLPHLNSRYAKNRNVKQRQDCAKSFDKQMISQFIEQEETVKNILEFWKKKEVMCADMFNVA